MKVIDAFAAPHRSGYTLYCRTDDGEIWKSIPRKKGAQHRGWLKLSAEVLPTNFDALEDARRLNVNSENARIMAEKRVAKRKRQLDQALVDLNLLDSPERAEGASG